MVYQPRTQKGTPLDSAIAEMDVIAETYPDDREYLDIVKGSLIRIRGLHSSGELSVQQASAKLFDTYFHHQSSSQDFYPLAGILRVVGDDFGIQLGADPDDLWESYQRSLDRHS